MLKSTYEWAIRKLYYLDVTGCNTADGLSTEADLKDAILVGVDMTPDGDSWNAASMTFQASPTTVSSDFQDVYNDTNVEYAVLVAANRHVILTPDVFLGERFLRVRSGTNAVAVPQDASRTIRLWLRRTK